MEFRENFQEVKIKYNPPDKNNNKPTYNNGKTMTDRKLLETSFQPIPSSNHLAKPITRKVAYETSSKFHTEQVQFHDENLFVIVLVWGVILNLNLLEIFPPS
jgi:hypothetical protein